MGVTTLGAPILSYDDALGAHERLHDVLRSAFLQAWTQYVNGQQQYILKKIALNTIVAQPEILRTRNIISML